MRQNNRDVSSELTGRPGLAWWYWLPVVAYAGLIFFLSSLSNPEVYTPSFLYEIGDKSLHAFEYGVLGILCYRAFRHGSGAWAARYALHLAIVAAAAYGVTDEIHQVFVPLREADAGDLLMDTIGAAIGATGWRSTVEP
ncbi:MAG: VanZ family protein [Nitrospiraceae bacterium]